MIELTQQQGLRREVLAALEDILRRWQKISDRRLTPQEIANVYSLFSAWEASSCPESHRQYGLHIGPLLCHDVQQQNQFQPFWQKYWQEPAQATEDIHQHGQAQTTAVNPDINNKSSIAVLNRRRRIALRILTLAILMLFAFIGWNMRSVEKVEPVVVEVVNEAMSNPAPGTQAKPEQAEQRNRPYLKQVPKRQPSPGPTFTHLHQQHLDKVEQFIMGGLLALVLLLIILIWWVRRVSFDSQHSAAKANQQIEYKVAIEDIDKDLIPGFRNALAKLRFDRLGEEVINWPKTLKTIAEQAGFAQLHYSQRKRQLDYLIISDNRHLRDQSAWLMQRLGSVLKKANIRVDYYDFDRYPEWVRAKGRQHSKAISLQQLLATHNESRIILAVNHELLFYRITGETQHWLSDLQGRLDYQLLLLSTPTPSQTEQLQRQGYPYRILNQQTDLGALLSQQKQQQNKHKNQTISGFDDHWLDDIRPESMTDVIAWIKQSVGAEGLRLLGILSLYPKLQGDLSFALLQWFKRPECQQPLQSQTFMQVITLPWCRQGWLPQWLRDALLKQLSVYDYQHASGFYQQLFAAEQAKGVKTLQLDIQKAAPWWHLHWMRSLFSQARFDSPLRDPIFAKILLAPRQGITRLLLPHRLLQALPRAAVTLWIPILALVFSAGGFLSVSYACWHYWGANWYSQDLLQDKQQEYADVTVLVRYHPDAKPQAELLGAGLDASGFKIAWQEDKSINSNSINAPGTLASELSNIVRYMSWGSVFSVSTETENNLITLAKHPQTGQVFRDLKPHPAHLPTEYEKELNWQKAKSGVNDTTQPVITYNPKIKPLLPKMINIPAGAFDMGSPENETEGYSGERPVHKVKLKVFTLAETELSFAEWDQCVLAGACRVVDDEGWGRGKRPVINVSWDDAQTYIRWLNQTQAFSAPNAYRLPTEAEWEYAARATMQSAYYWQEASQCEYANGADLALKKDGYLGDGWTYADCDDGFAFTAPVAQFKANLWGLYDMSGNVWEWTQDCWHISYQGAPEDGSAWLEADQGECDRRSVRGGGWGGRPAFLRSAYRSWNDADVAYDSLGFRLARTL